MNVWILSALCDYDGSDNLAVYAERPSIEQIRLLIPEITQNEYDELVNKGMSELHDHIWDDSLEFSDYCSFGVELNRMEVL